MTIIIRSGKMKQLYLLEVEPQYDDSILDKMLISLPDERKEKLLRYRHDIDRKIGIYSQILIRCLICRVSSLKYHDIQINEGPTGKPYLACNPRYEFNISHTRNAVAAALSDEPIGVDIERIREIDINIAKSVFSDKELNWLQDASEDRNRRFFDIWTKKEALVKYHGIGLSGDLKSYDVTGPLPGEEIFTFELNGYTISVCSKMKFYNSDVKNITEAKLVEMWRHDAF